jgi:arylsulfatase A-like enzyme
MAAGRREESIATVDITPTIAALLDLAPPAGVDGKDLTSFLLP